MALIKEFTRMANHIVFELDDIVQTGSLVNVNFNLYSEDKAPASLSLFQYYSGSTYHNATLATPQYITDVTNIPLTTKKKDFTIIWDATVDVPVHYSESILFKIGIGDATGSEITRYEKSASVDINFLPSEDIVVISPYDYDYYLDIHFKSQYSVVPMREHFNVKVDDNANFNNSSGRLITLSSETDQTYWKVSGSAFPAAGVITSTSSLGQLDVTWSTGSGTAGRNSGETWYIQVERDLFAL